jgi:N-formylglutamate deformylase
MEKTYAFQLGNSPIVAAAIHEGHLVRPELEDLFALNAEERLREEDPFTARWVACTDNQIIVQHSRFETDVNRPRNKAVYQLPEDAWGLQVWKKPLSTEVINRSYQLYDQFYADLKIYFDKLFQQHDKIVVYDIHSYNHRRDSKEMMADAVENPEINIGTKNLDGKSWRPLLDAMMESFRAFDYDGRSLDTRENIKFKGGYFGEWLYTLYGSKICPVSIEFKKFFMDEWTGKPFEKDIQLISQLLQQSIAPVSQALRFISTT